MQQKYRSGRPYARDNMMKCSLEYPIQPEHTTDSQYATPLPQRTSSANPLGLDGATATVDHPYMAQKQCFSLRL
ncbi:hypothetical protein JZ751_010043 [Albula glossodonta]|uniref:Uncharacterized protein n=1 Tax=Albula glossodonta TaxID=121402 RepID=A0A8T2N1R3_9TELE|nr:hypothetical protein JZ751_010043 [Albula glossodonta]